MLVIMNQHATAGEVDAVITAIREMGYSAHPIPGTLRTAIGITGNQGPIDQNVIESLPGVVQTIRVTKTFKLVSRETKPEDTVVNVGGVAIGGVGVAVIAGPCSVEAREQIIRAAEQVKAAGGNLLRGGAFKPRTSPYSFQGLGETALKWLAEARAATGLPVVTEVLDSESVELAERYADMLQIGARNMQNYVLLSQVAKRHKPILLKRGPAATLDELLNAAEYILAAGNYHVVLCERGIRSFSDFSRHTLDLNIIPAIKELSHLPVITDPSHGTGKRSMVIPLARASIAAGADGLMVEVHPDPQHAFSDGYQSLYPQQFRSLMESVQSVAAALGRGLIAPSPR